MDSGKIDKILKNQSKIKAMLQALFESDSESDDSSSDLPIADYLSMIQTPSSTPNSCLNVFC